MARVLPQEVEIKLRVDDLAALRRRLRSIGARARKGSRDRVFEHNVLFDLPGQALRKRGALLRLRWQIAARSGIMPVCWSKSPDAVLTYKGRARVRDGYKVADELEISISDPERLAAILQALGFETSFRYEKFRTEFKLRKIPGLAVDLDETPIGDFVELEGPRRSIDRAASLLGYDRGDYITGSYAALYSQFCCRQRRHFGDMLFHVRKR
jgi:adenylate cyclase, class 2